MRELHLQGSVSVRYASVGALEERQKAFQSRGNTMIDETMTVVRTHGPRDYRVEEIPVPSPGPGEVLIEVDACGICASDMKCWLGGELFWGSDGKSGYCEPPAVR